MTEDYAIYKPRNAKWWHRLNWELVGMGLLLLVFWVCVWLAVRWETRKVQPKVKTNIQYLQPAPNVLWTKDKC